MTRSADDDAPKGLEKGAIFCLLAVVIYAIIAVQGRMFRSNNIVKLAEKATVDVWVQHVKNFPVHAKDRYAFREMGFRAAMYAELLRMGGEKDIASLEESLWPIVHDLRQVRRNVGVASGATTASRLADLLAKPRTRGIVTCTDAKRFRSTLQLIATLRVSLHCTLPIQIYHSDIGDIPELLEKVVETLPDVKVINLEDSNIFNEDILGFEDLNIKKEHAQQAMAMMATDFAEFLYLGPDAVFLVDPETLFDDKGYQKTGSLFFHDYNNLQMADSQRFLNFLRQQYDEGLPSETFGASPFYNFGLDKYQDPQVLALDKRRPGVFASLLLNLWFHSDSPRDKIWHAHFPECRCNHTLQSNRCCNELTPSYSPGLTESIWLSFELTGIPYYFVPQYPGAVGNFEGSTDDPPWEPTICPAHAMHFIGRSSYADHDGVPAWINGGLKLFPRHTEYLRISAWATRGRWQQTRLGMCIIGADARSPDLFDISQLWKAHIRADEAFEELFGPVMEYYNISSV